MKRIFFSLIFVTTFVLSACSVRIDLNPSRIIGSGKAASETRPVSGFDQVSVDGIGQAEISVGSSESLKIEGDDNIVPLVISEVSNGKLSIRLKENTSFTPRVALRYTITVKSLSALSLDGAARAHLPAVELGALTLNMDGASQATLDSLSATSLSVDLNGASTVRINGGGMDTLTARLDGGSQLIAPDLACSTASVTANGGSRAEVWVKTTLNADLNGAANLKYYGQPGVTQHTDGAARLVSLGNH